MNKFLLYGFFGGWNSGDEAIVQSVRSLVAKTVSSPASQSESSLPQQDESITSSVVCTKIRPEYIPQYESQSIEVLTISNWRRVFALLKDHQLIVGGGQMITGDRSYKQVVILWLLLLVSRFRGRPGILVGIGAEGVRRRTARWLCRRITASAAVVNCRDPYTKELLSNAGCDQRKLRLTADVVLSGILADAGRPHLDQERCRFRRPFLAIGVHHSPIRAYSGEEELAAMAKRLVEAFPEYDVVLVSNDAREDFDAGLIQSLRQSLDHTRIKFQDFVTLDDVLATYANAACVISVRMHPLILGLIHGRPVVGIDRSNKVRALAARAGFDLYDPEKACLGDLSRAVRLAIERAPADLSELRKLACANFDSLLATGAAKPNSTEL